MNAARIQHVNPGRMEKSRATRAEVAAAESQALTNLDAVDELKGGMASVLNALRILGVERSGTLTLDDVAELLRVVGQ